MSDWSSGTIHVYANPKLNGSRTILYLGTGERAPQSSHENIRLDVPNDLVGGAYDRMHVGRRAQTSWVITRTNHLRFEIMCSAPGGDPGGDDSESLGTLLGTEDEYFTVWFLKARRNVQAMIALGMPSGRRYPYSELVSWQVTEGLQPNTYAVAFQHNMHHEPNDPTTFTLFDEDMTAVASLPITTI